MLLAIRERAKGWMAYLIIVLIGLPFIFFGVYDYFFSSSASNVAATVGDREISMQLVDQRAQALRRRMEQLLGENADPSFLDDARFRQQAAEQIVNQTVLEQYVRDRGYGLSDKGLLAAIQNEPTFQVDGRFDREAYRRYLRATGYNEAGFEAQQRVDTMVEQMRAGVYATMPVTRADLALLVRIERETRDIAFLTVPAAQFRDADAVTEDAIQAYFNEHQDEFVSPERVKVAYIDLNLDAVKGQIEIDDEAIARRYEERESEFTSPESRQMSHILLAVGEGEDEDAVRQEAKALRERAVAGEDFADLARQYSDDPGSGQRGGDLGAVSRGMMVEPFEKAAFALNEGDISEPVKTRFGWHIIKVTSIDGGETKPLEEVRAEIRQDLVEEQAQNQLFEVANEVANLSFEQPDSLEPAAEAVGVSVQTTDSWITRRGQRGGIFADPKVMDALFSPSVLNDRRNSELLQLDENRYVVVRVNEYDPERPQTLDEVSGRIRAILADEAAQAQALEKGEALLAEAQAGRDLSELADLHDYPLTDPGSVTRAGNGINGVVVRSAFQAEVTDENAPLVQSVQLPNGDFVVLKIAGVTPGSLDDLSEEEQTQFRQRLSRVYGEAALVSTLQTLREEADVKIYEERLQ